MGTIQSVERALSILEIFSPKEKEIGVTEIAKRLSIHKSTCFGLLSTLQSRGYIEQNMESGKYRLSLKVFELGQTYQAGIELRDIARPFLQQLVEQSRETVHLVIRYNTEAVYIEKVEGPSAISIISQVGRRVVLHCTGVGKCLLAYFSPQNFERVVANGLDKHGPNTIVDKGKLQEVLAAIRENGYGTDDEEIEAGLRCVAAPIFNHEGEAIAAISISGPTTRITKAKIPKLATVVKNATGAISLKLGYNP